MTWLYKSEGNCNKHMCFLKRQPLPSTTLQGPKQPKDVQNPYGSAFHISTSD